MKIKEGQVKVYYQLLCNLVSKLVALGQSVKQCYANCLTASCCALKIGSSAIVNNRQSSACSRQLACLHS